VKTILLILLLSLSVLAEDKIIYKHEYCAGCRLKSQSHSCYKEKEYLILFINLWGEVEVLKRYTEREWEKLLSGKVGE